MPALPCSTPSCDQRAISRPRDKLARLARLLRATQVEEFVSGGSLENFLRVTDAPDLGFPTLATLVADIVAGAPPRLAAAIIGQGARRPMRANRM